MIEMKNQHKATIISGLLILLVWGLYITFIYMDSIPEIMKEEVCVERVIAATKTCNTIYTNFGGMP